MKKIFLYLRKVVVTYPFTSFVYVETRHNIFKVVINFYEFKFAFYTNFPVRSKIGHFENCEIIKIRSCNSTKQCTITKYSVVSLCCMQWRKCMTSMAVCITNRFVQFPKCIWALMVCNLYYMLFATHKHWTHWTNHRNRHMKREHKRMIQIPEPVMHDHDIDNIQPANNLRHNKTRLPAAAQ